MVAETKGFTSKDVKEYNTKAKTALSVIYLNIAFLIIGLLLKHVTLLQMLGKLNAAISTQKSSEMSFFAASHTRPDIMFAVNFFSQFPD